MTGGKNRPEPPSGAEKRGYRPDVLQIAYMRKLGGQVEKLSGLTERLIDLTIPEGRKDELVCNVADKWRTVPGRYPWFAFDLFNDGPDPVYFDVNGHRSLRPEYDAPINPGESVHVDFRAKVVQSVHVTCAPEGAAKIRIQAVK